MQVGDQRVEPRGGNGELAVARLKPNRLVDGARRGVFVDVDGGTLGLREDGDGCEAARQGGIERESVPRAELSARVERKVPVSGDLQFVGAEGQEQVCGCLALGLSIDADGCAGRGAGDGQLALGAGEVVGEIEEQFAQVLALKALRSLGLARRVGDSYLGASAAILDGKVDERGGRHGIDDSLGRRVTGRQATKAAGEGKAALDELLPNALDAHDVAGVRSLLKHFAE